MFLSCDWGTSSFRLRLINAANLECISEIRTGEGVATIYPRWVEKKATGTNRVGYYGEVLKKHITTIEEKLQISLMYVPVVISGMASSSVGMVELPYKKLPFSIREIDLMVERIKAGDDLPHELFIVSGVRTEDDVMRGEETQLIGCNAPVAAGKHLYIFPGTHSKHILVEGGNATHFHTYMTGEFFQLLTNNSILSESVSAEGSIHNKENLAAFELGVLDSVNQNLLQRSFMVRTNSLFNRLSKNQNYWYLSGLLIGTELVGLSPGNFDSINLVSDDNLMFVYQHAFKILDAGSRVNTISIDIALVRGQVDIYRRFT